MAPRRRVRRGGLLLQRRRLAAVAVCVAVAYALLMLRAVQLHALDAEWLSARAAAQHERTLRLEPLRGDLLDRHGELLAQSANVESVAASPRRIDDPARVSRALARALGMRRSEVSHRLGGGGAFVWVKRWVSPDEADRVRRADLAGVQLLPERKRFYPNRDLAAAYLGFAGHDGVGLGGLELAFENALRGRQQAVPALRDGRGQTLPRVGADPSARRGGRLVLALDSRLQHHAEQALDRARERTGARRATLVALDPRNGDLLALAERPSFNPNRFWEEDPRAFRARAFTDPFEPGSTLKPFVVALALEAHSVTPSDRFDCENGSWRVLDRTIRDFRPHGVLSVHDILRVSSNIGAAKVADRLGSVRLVEGLRRLGFGSRTGSGYPGEAPGVVHAIRETQAVERANLAFGQGLSVTAIQLASIGASLANGGRRVYPRLALRLDGNGEQIDLPSGLGEQVLPPEVARSVLDMMRAVVASGSGRAAALPHHAVAGKTGTAQKVIDGVYSRDRYVASFLGIVPADAPELVVVIVLDEPRGVHTGGAVAAPVFRDVAGFAVEQLAVPVGGAE